MFKLDYQVFKMVYDYSKFIGEGFGFSVIEGFFINGIVIIGTVLVAINNLGASKKC